MTGKRQPMHSCVRFTAQIAAAALLVIGVSTASAQSVDSLEATADRTFSWANSGSPGCAVGVSHGGRPVLLEAYGAASLELGVPLTLESVFDAGSVAKQFTAAAVLLLAQEGDLSLDDPVRNYVPEFPDYETPVTIRHLLSHTSGVREWDSVALLTGWSSVVSRYYPPEILDIVSRQRGLNFEPGSAHAYANTNYFLAALVVERVSRLPFVEFTKQRLFEPVGMSHTRWRDDVNRVVPGRVKAYAPAGPGTFRVAMPLWDLVGYGGLLTTVGDLLAWNDALASGRVLGRDIVRLMQTPAALVGGGTAPTGLGLDSRRYRGLHEVSSGGADRGFRAHTLRYPEHEVTVVVLCNSASAYPRGDAQTIAAALVPFSPPSPPMAPEAGAVLSEQELEAMAGLYRDLRTGAALRIDVTGGAWTYPGGAFFGPATFRPVSTRKFVAEQGDLQGEFVVPERGPIRLVVRSPSVPMSIEYERVEEWAPSAEELATYAGRYTSEEAEATFTIVANDGQLALNMGLRRGVRLVPRYRDAFEAGPLGTVAFVRDGGGAIVGLTVSDERSFGVWFDRQ